MYLYLYKLHLVSNQIKYYYFSKYVVFMNVSNTIIMYYAYSIIIIMNLLLKNMNNTQILPNMFR